MVFAGQFEGNGSIEKKGLFGWSGGSGCH